MAHSNYPPNSSVPRPTDQPSHPYMPPVSLSSYPPPPPVNYPATQPEANYAMTHPSYPPPPSLRPHHANAPLQAIYGYAPMSQPAPYPPAPVPAPQGSYTVPGFPTVHPTPSQTAIITNPIPVVGSQYCLPHLLDLVIVRKLMTLTNDFTVTDINNNMMFKAKGKFFSLHNKRVLMDAAGKPVLTLRHKILTAHSRWQVFRGGSSEPGDLILHARTSSVIQLKTKLNVYLGNRTSEDVCDFKVEGSWTDRSCVVFVGESQTIAAQMYKKDTAESYFLGKDTFMVIVYPNIDYAFVVALILILDAINTEDDDVSLFY